MRGFIGGERLALGILFAGTILTFTVRIFMTHSDLVIGDDTGTYLATLNFIKGTDFSGHGGERPPLVGFFMWPFVGLFGTFAGAKIAAVFASVLGSLSFYLLARKIASPLAASVGAICFIWLPIYAETLGWGFLSILVIATALLTLWGWVRYSEDPSLDRALSASALMAVMCYLNQTPIPLLALVVGAALLALVIKDPKTHVKYLLPAGALLVLLSLGSIPYTMAHMSNLAVPTANGDPVNYYIQIKDPVTSLIAVVGCIGFAMAGRKIGGVPGMVIGVGGALTSITQAITVPGSLSLITVLGRSILWFWMFAALVGVWGIPKMFRNISKRFTQGQFKAFAGVAVIFAFIYLSSSWYLRFESVMPHYTTLDEHSVAALDWVKERTDPDEKVGAYPVTLGFYVQGLANRPSVTTVPDGGNSGEVSYKEAVRGWWAMDDKAVRCTLGFIKVCDSYLSDLGVKYLLTKEQPDRPLDPVFQSGDMMVYRVSEDRGW